MLAADSNLSTNSLALALAYRAGLSLFPWEHRCLFLLPSSLGVANRLMELTVASCYTVLVDVSGITDRQRGIILYSYTNWSQLASPIDNL